MTPTDAENLIHRLTGTAISQANALTKRTFRTRGGRVGSGMGLLLEALWGYCMNEQLDQQQAGIEIGWIATHEYNDFACMERDADWDASTKAGEVLRVEIKSMVASAAESKAHFDKIVAELGAHDLLVVLLWDWEKLDDLRLYPAVRDCFVGNAIEVAMLRDELHEARGGTFVQAGACPDGCLPTACTHIGEPLNASGKRERLSGPKAAKPAGVTHAANFGGLVRMLKTNSDSAATVFRRTRKSADSAHDYINFIHRNLPSEEANHFRIGEWRELAIELGTGLARGASKLEYRNAVAAADPGYQDLLRDRFAP